MLRIEDLKNRISKAQVLEWLEQFLNENLTIDNHILYLKTGNENQIINILWIFKCLARKKPNYFKDYQKHLLDCYDKNPNNDTISRLIVTIFEDLEVNKSIEARLFDVVYKNLISKKTTVATRAFSITVAHKIANRNPGLLRELLMVIQEVHDRYASDSAAIKHRSEKLLKGG